MNPDALFTAIEAEIEATRTELGFLEERLTEARDAAEDALIRALLAETPLAHREEHEAREAFERTRRLHDEARALLLSLEVERDRLRALAAARP